MYTALINRILDTLKANEALEKEIQEFRFGELPEAGDGNSFPSVKVTTTQNPWQNADAYGIAIPNTDIQTTAIFALELTVAEPTPEDTKARLLDLVNTVIDILHGNPRFAKADGTDPLCIRSIITSVDEDGQYRGKVKQVATIKLKCQVGSQWILKLPGDISLNLISKPLESPGLNLDKDLLDDATVMYSALERSGELHAEYTSGPEVQDAIRDLMFAKKEIPVTLQFQNYSRNYTVVIKDNVATARFDELERLVLSMLLIL